ncbi:uncharacterized protein F5891DRAFT_261448 [Suillus fuscotomentosus]|uniref:Uncharacterized protein n=1 Tax=Suillus fuscotomentosus TaxID=1912939 RepID=A0AAD4DNW5_9AGAM|nr:uncharacterized protein F5891DRAFT_261448 [Suillus fuscotomentosus]KAG1886940.1 hypothetical protein F5891DRAFT_261448 [Suillus fuscotomentosus]
MVVPETHSKSGYFVAVRAIAPLLLLLASASRIEQRTFTRNVRQQPGMSCGSNILWSPMSITPTTFLTTLESKYFRHQTGNTCCGLSMAPCDPSSWLKR